MSARDRQKIKEFTERERPFFINESGVVVHLKPIPLDDPKLIEDGLRSDYLAANEPLDPPEIEIEIEGVGGKRKVKRILTEKTVVVPDDPEESERRLALWQAHQEALNRFQIELGRLTQEYLLDGIDEELPADETWLKRMERRHIRVPEDEYERLLFYKRRVLIVTPGDFGRLQSELALLSSSGMLIREEVEAQVASFLNKTRVHLPSLDNSGTERETASGKVGA